LENTEENRDELTFQEKLVELTSTVLGSNAFQNQKEYLKNTPKPENMSVKQWLNRLKNINSYLPLMEQDGQAFSEADLISEVITKNIPSAWTKDYRLAELHLKKSLKDIMVKLTVIEENVKTHPKGNQEKQNKQFKNPCRKHNGSHEWDDCRLNPKNQKNNEDKDNHSSNNRSRNNGGNNRNCEENRRAESDQSSQNRTHHRHCSRSSSSRSSSVSHEYHNMDEQEAKYQKELPSSEILIAIPAKKGFKKYTTYIGLVDSGASASLVNKELVEMSDFDIKMQKKPTKWDTANGVFKTDGSVIIENFNLPQFTRKRAVTAPFNMYHKKPTDKYDVILGRDLLKEIGFDIHYSASQFVWDNVIIDMVPSGHWMKEKIKALLKRGTQRESSNVRKIVMRPTTIQMRNYV
jgi:hypothetical protein